MHETRPAHSSWGVAAEGVEPCPIRLIAALPVHMALVLAAALGYCEDRRYTKDNLLKNPSAEITRLALVPP